MSSVSPVSAAPAPGKRELLTGNHAAAYGAMLAGNANGGMVVAAYPITPQTDIIKRLSDMVADDTLSHSRFVPVEGEHSAMAVVHAASMTGARAFTATSSQGLLLMGEMLWWCAGSRCPAVLVNVNRAIAPAWSIWTDQQDSLSMRDTGWLQYYCSDNQEVLDSVLMGYRVAEQVGLPVMVILDAFVLSHTSEEVFVPPAELVEDFLPRFEPEVRLHPDKPTTFAGLAIPALYPSFRRKIDRAMARVPEVEAATEAEFERTFGRSYSAVESYRTDDADLILVATATTARTARVTIDAARADGIKAGLVRIRRFRPFPGDELRAALGGAAKVAVVDRNISFGGEGIFAGEIKAALYGRDAAQSPQVHGFIAGLGGQDITPQTLRDILDRTRAADATPAEPTWIGVLPEQEVPA